MLNLHERSKVPPLAASATHPCLYCGGRVVLMKERDNTLWQWRCPTCGHVTPRQWYPTGRGFPLIGVPHRISSLDRSRLLSISDGRASEASPMADLYREDTDWVKRETTRFQRNRMIFY